MASRQRPRRENLAVSFRASVSRTSLDPDSLAHMREALGDLQLEARARVPEQGREHLVDLVGVGRAQRDRLEEFVCEIADDRKLDAKVDLIADCIARRKLVGEQVHARSPPPKYPGQTRDLHDGSRSLTAWLPIDHRNMRHSLRKRPCFLTRGGPINLRPAPPRCSPAGRGAR